MLEEAVTFAVVVIVGLISSGPRTSPGTTMASLEPPLTDAPRLQEQFANSCAIDYQCLSYATVVGTLRTRTFPVREVLFIVKWKVKSDLTQGIRL